jgi:hypothetical protein
MFVELWCTVLFLVTLASPGVEIRILDSVQSKAHSRHVVRNGQAVEIDLRALRLSIVLPSGKVGYADVAMLSEPKTKLFWWFYQTVEQPDDKGILQSPLDALMICVADDKVAGFNLTQAVLSVRDSTSHFSSMDEGQTKVLARIKENAERIEDGSMRWAKRVPLGRALPDFFVLKDSAAPPRGTIREVARMPGQWRLILDGPNTNSAEVILDDDNRVIRATVLPLAGR